MLMPFKKIILKSHDFSPQVYRSAWAVLQVMLSQLSLPVICLSLYLSLPPLTPNY